MTRTLTHGAERWPLAKPFVISRGTFHHVDVLVVDLRDGEALGRGEATGVSVRGDTPATMAAEIERVRAAVEAGADRAALAGLLPPGGARNALDCALWELEAKQAGTTVAALAGVEAASVATVSTVSVGTPEAMAAEAAVLAAFPFIKVKLGADDPDARIAAVRAARADARLIVDANTAWTPAELRAYAPALAGLGVEMIEQPCPPELDGELARADSPIPLCADESCHTTADLPRLAAAFSIINIKLDKTGGLTEALALARAAQAAGFGLMVGNMLGTSLAMAPASLIAPMCRFVDMDGPLLLAHDREPGMRIKGATIMPMVPDVWG